MPGVDLEMSIGTGYVFVRLRGELDVSTAADDVRTLTPQATSGARIIIDLAKLTFMDCFSLRELISVRGQARLAGGDMALAEPQPIVLRILLLTGMIQSIPVFASVHEAVIGTQPLPPAPFTPAAAIRAVQPADGT